MSKARLSEPAEEEALVLDEANANQPRASHRTTKRAFAALAAVLIVGLIIAWWQPWQSPSQGTRFLGGDVRISAPANPGNGFGLDFPLPSRGSFRIRVLAEDPTTPIMTIDRLATDRWQPDTREWPELVEIEVVALDAMGDEVGRGRLQYRR